ncbi:protein disulfide isomerase [Tothia fuscella]|uniref:Protein disulfide isomerase n=1 Tax=Tothia fuscella TaxID=1048955 RepID=A0A9P4TZH1_9PEZI|nr:protein disulfide isomerase [Tothia fuscella]
MRFSCLLPLLALVSPLLAAPAEAGPTDAPVSRATKFNGEEVPPLRALSGTTLDQDIKQGYWLVEFFSPYCHHCKQQAPIWQTAYEFYYTLKPVQSSSSKKEDSPKESDTQDLNSFTRYYNFKFAKVDCIAFGTACNDKKVGSFPTIILFKDGKEVKKKVGVQDLSELSKWVEETLESIRPGSRPKEGPRLPQVGASSVDATARPASPEAKDKDPEAGKKAGEKHAAVASSIGAAGATASPTKAVATPKETANVKGKSVELTAETFQKLVTTTHDPWFVKFYAPWCGHCQALAPNWASMAREMKGVLNIGSVNCDVEKRLCKDAHAKAYPTLLFFRGGERVEYNGLRGVGDLTAFAKTAVDVGSGVTDVDKATFEKLEETEEVLFVYFYDHATTAEDFSALDRLTLSLIGHAKLVKTSDPALAKRFKISTWPRLMVSRSGKASYYQHLAPKDMRDFRQVLAWMKTVWQPIVPELTASNAREIMSSNKVVVLGILSRERSDEFAVAKKEIKNAALEWMDRQDNALRLERQELRDAKQLRIEEAEDRNDAKGLRAAKAIRIKMDEVERREVGFAWVDGVFWERWIRTTFGVDVKDGERVVINDEANRQYWDTTSTGNPIVPSRTSILETLPKTISNPPKLAPKSSTSRIGHVFWLIRTSWSRHPYLSLIGLVGMCCIGVIAGRRARRRGGGGALWLGSEKEAFGGILGMGSGSGNGGGKVD